MSENLIAIGWVAGLRSRGITAIMRGNRVAWLPFPTELTVGEMAILKSHRQAIKDAIRALPPVNDDGLTGPTGAAAVGAPPRASIAAGVKGLVTSDAASSPTILVVPHLDATGKLDEPLATVKRDTKCKYCNQPPAECAVMREQRPTVFYVLHPLEAQKREDERRNQEFRQAMGLRDDAPSAPPRPLTAVEEAQAALRSRLGWDAKTVTG